MSQSLRSGKPAAPSLSLVDCFQSVIDSLQGQNPRRAAKGLKALTGFEEHIRLRAEKYDRLRAQNELLLESLRHFEHEVDAMRKAVVSLREEMRMMEDHAAQNRVDMPHAMQ